MKSRQSPRSNRFRKQHHKKSIGGNDSHFDWDGVLDKDEERQTRLDFDNVPTGSTVAPELERRLIHKHSTLKAMGHAKKLNIKSLRPPKFTKRRPVSETRPADYRSPTLNPVAETVAEIFTDVRHATPPPLGPETHPASSMSPTANPVVAMQRVAADTAATVTQKPDETIISIPKKDQSPIIKQDITTIVENTDATKTSTETATKIHIPNSTPSNKGICQRVFTERLSHKRYKDMPLHKRILYKSCKHLFSRKSYRNRILSQKAKDRKYKPWFSRKTGGRRSKRRSSQGRRSRTRRR